MEQTDLSVISLTSRERQVLSLLVAGCSNKEIANRIFVSDNTVKYHLKSVYAKLGTRRRTQAVLVAGRLKAPADAPPEITYAGLAA